MPRGETLDWVGVYRPNIDLTIAYGMAENQHDRDMTLLVREFPDSKVRQTVLLTSSGTARWWIGSTTFPSTAPTACFPSAVDIRTCRCGRRCPASLRQTIAGSWELDRALSR